jgi:hypothetical protein
MSPAFAAALSSVAACDVCDRQLSGSCGAECGGSGSWNEGECRCVCPRSELPPPSRPTTCDSDRACAVGEHCRQGECTKVACVTDGDCNRNGVCDLDVGTCRRACETNEACAPGFACIKGLCVAWVTYCGPSRPCPKGLACDEAYTGTCAAICHGGGREEHCFAPYSECVDRAGEQICVTTDYRSCRTDSECRSDSGARCVAADRCFSSTTR